MNTLAERLGAEIKRLRENRGWPLRGLELHTGISNPMLSQIERGVRMPGLKTLLRLAKAFDITVDCLLIRAGAYQLNGKAAGK